MSIFRDLFRNEPIRRETENRLPEWVTRGRQNLFEDTRNQQYEGYGGRNPWESQSDQTRRGLSDLGGLNDYWGDGGEGNQFMQGLMQRGPQSVQTEGLFDADDIQKYMNPYTDNALKPALAKISEQAAAARSRVGARATSAGAFGDTRHFHAENGVNQNESNAIGDTASQFMMNAFRDAIGAKTGDLNRKFQGDMANANFANQHTQQQAGLMGQLNQSRMSALDRLIQAGNQQDDRSTQGERFNYEQFLNRQNWNQDQRNFMERLLSGNNGGTTTQQEYGGQGPGWGLVGGGLRGLFSRI